MKYKESVGNETANKISFLESLVSPVRLLISISILPNWSVVWPEMRAAGPFFWLHCLQVMWLTAGVRSVCRYVNYESFAEWLLLGNDFDLEAETGARLAALAWPAGWETTLGAHRPWPMPEMRVYGAIFWFLMTGASISSATGTMSSAWRG